MAQEVYSYFEEQQIPIEWVNQEKRGFQPGADSIKLVTMHSSKGLEFPVVFVPGIGRMPSNFQDSQPEDESRLLYVAMTRAVNQLVMTCDHYLLSARMVP